LYIITSYHGNTNVLHATQPLKPQGATGYPMTGCGVRYELYGAITTYTVYSAADWP